VRCRWGPSVGAQEWLHSTPHPVVAPRTHGEESKDPRWPAVSDLNINLELLPGALRLGERRRCDGVATKPLRERHEQDFSGSVSYDFDSLARLHWKGKVGVIVAWDFQTEPEFEEKLAWMREFVKEEIFPIETLRLSYDDALKV